MNKIVPIIIVLALILAGGYWYYAANNTQGESTITPTQEENTEPVAVSEVGDKKHLTDKQGMTLYVNVKDENPSGEIKQTCNAECEKVWTPYLLVEGEAAPSASTDAVLSKLNLFTRADGKVQYALGTQPLYRFSGDVIVGQTNGVSGDWMVATP